MIHGSVRDAVITLPGVGWDKAVEPTTGVEPVNLFLTKEVLYLLSYVGPRESGEDTGQGQHVTRRCRSFLLRCQFAAWRSPPWEAPGTFQSACSPSDNGPPHSSHHLLPGSRSWWRGEDSNLRRHRRQIYSLLPLATWEPLHFKPISKRNLVPLATAFLCIRQRREKQ